jgi:gamma-butyrobetaine dioxygenase
LNHANRYFKHPPRYQILHCLRNRVEGGASIFVDALGAAEELRRTRPAQFQTLVETPVSFHYINDGHHLHHEHPTFELPTVQGAHSDASSASSPTPVIHVNYSPPFMGPLFPDTPPQFFDAFKEYTDMLRRQESTLIYTLKEGEAVLFDNRRVLHARTSFRSVAEGPDTGVQRWLKGCYLEADALLDHSRVLMGKLEATAS